jgi:bifunctional UDP-N-acetylglucosamine pyrophosphorylase/glucosamine-1-phosphate N-acetyltransferase
VSQLVAVILAAGKSKRMKSERPKVLHDLCGRPLLEYVLDAARQAGATRFLVVVGFGADQVRLALKEQKDLEFVEQVQQLGTGHAVEMCRPKLVKHGGPVVVLAGDMPLIRGDTLRRLLDTQRTEQASCVLGTATVENPTGLGRILRDERGEFIGIVEERDANETQKAVREVNLSFYAFHGPALLEALTRIRPNNVQQEFYLTDCTAVLRGQGRRVLALNVIPADEALGVNSRSELAQAHAAMQRRIQTRWMDDGVSIIDPATTQIDARAVIGADSVILPFTTIGGPCRIGARCRIGPHADVGAGCQLDDGVETGSFVVLERSHVHAGAHTGHLVRFSDAEVKPSTIHGPEVVSPDGPGDRVAAEPDGRPAGTARTAARAAHQPPPQPRRPLRKTASRR